MSAAKIIYHGQPVQPPTEWTIGFDGRTFDVTTEADQILDISEVWIAPDGAGEHSHQLSELEIGAEAMAEISKQINDAIAEWNMAHAARS